MKADERARRGIASGELVPAPVSPEGEPSVPAVAEGQEAGLFKSDESASSKAGTKVDSFGDTADAPSEAGKGGTEASPDDSAGVVTEAERLFENAKAASLAGKLEEAAALYRVVISMDSGHVRARNNLGILLDEMGDHDAALEHLEAALGVEPDNPEVLTNVGAALAAQGRYDEAAAQLKRAAKLDPEGTEVRANLGFLYFRRGLYAQADQELRWVCDQDPHHALAHLCRGEALNRLGRLDEAVRVLERASELQPNRARVYYLLGILYDKKNLRQEAELMYKRARELVDP